MEDKKIACSDCKYPFFFSAQEQEFFKTKGFAEPRRCPKCRIRRREVNFGKTSQDLDQQKIYKITCSLCSTETTVPFEPSPNRPIYCRECYQKMSKRSPNSNELTPAPIPERGN